MADLRLPRLLPLQTNDGLKDRLSYAVKQIEVHRRELENLRSRLEQRRQSLFETIVRATERKDDARAAVYANEHAELKKVVKVVTVSELALTQVMVRLESIRDVGDAIYHMTSAFRIIKKVSKSVSGLVPALETATDEVNSTLTETLAEMSNIGPDISIDVRTDEGEEIVEKAKKYAEERMRELKEDFPKSILTTTTGDSLLENAERVAVLATGSAQEDQIPPVLFPRQKMKDIEGIVYNYVINHEGDINVLKASSELRLSADDVEHAILRLVSDGKIRLGKSGVA